MSSSNQETPVAYLPEILTVIGSHLDRHDLFSCVQVCHLWNQLFTPFAWTTFNDKHFSQLKVDIDEDDTQSRRKVFKGWLRDMFTKNGHHIRHFTTHFDIAVEAAVATGSCTRLTSLTIIDVQRLKIDGDPVEAPSTRYQSNEGLSRYLISPLLKSFMPTDEVLFSVGCVRVWMALQRYWLLILANPLLESLYIGPHSTVEFKFKPEQFMYDSFATLTNLTRLRNDFRVLRLQTLLEVLPKLCSYTCVYFPWGLRSTEREKNLVLSCAFPQLETLDLIFDQATPATLFNLLEFLPNLEELTLDRVWRSYDTTLSSEDAVTDALARIGDRPIRLKELKLSYSSMEPEDWEDCEGTMERFVKPYLPHTTFSETRE